MNIDNSLNLQQLYNTSSYYKSLDNYYGKYDVNDKFAFNLMFLYFVYKYVNKDDNIIIIYIGKHINIKQYAKLLNAAKIYCLFYRDINNINIENIRKISDEIKNNHGNKIIFISNIDQKPPNHDKCAYNRLQETWLNILSPDYSLITFNMDLIEIETIIYKYMYGDVYLLPFMDLFSTKTYMIIKMNDINNYKHYYPYIYHYNINYLKTRKITNKSSYKLIHNMIINYGNKFNVEKKLIKPLFEQFDS